MWPQLRRVTARLTILFAFRIGFILFAFGFRQSLALDVQCDENTTNLCTLNVDGGVDVAVAAIIEENLTNSTDGGDFMFRLMTLDKYEKTLNDLFTDIDNETIVDDLPKQFYESAENLLKVDLECQHLTKIKSAAFGGAINLAEIDLDSNEILLIEENAFGDLANLTVLSLAKNKLTVIRASTFQGASNLRRLHLNQNKIEQIEDGAFSLPQLETILLQNNQLKTLSQGLFGGTPLLREAIFEENELTHIGDAFSRLSHLRILILDYNPIDDVNLLKFAQLPELRSLSLRKCGVRMSSEEPTEENIPHTNSTLEELHLAENDLSNGNRIMRQLAIFGRLELLNLEYNEFTHLNHIFEFRKMFPELKIVNLSFNPVKCKWIEMHREYLKKRDIKIIPYENSPNKCVLDDENAEEEDQSYLYY